MTTGVTFDYSLADKFVSQKKINIYRESAEAAIEKVLCKNGEGNEYLGWLDLPINYDKEEFKRIENISKKIQHNSEVFLVIGIGGSYLGARAAIEFLNNSFYNHIPKDKRKTPEIYFVGHNMSSAYVTHLIEVIGDRDFSVNVISKSGTTIESAISFRIFKDILINKYGKEGAANRIFATTDRSKGALKKLANEEGYECFVVPDDIGGRYSVLSAVGLLPIAVCGADINKMMSGAAAMRKRCINTRFDKNDAVMYAVIRNILYKDGKSIEVLANYEPSLHYVSEWWKQLYGESEGKDQKGLYPTNLDFTTDLHSAGQYIQDGARIIFETVLNLVKPSCCISITEASDNHDGLNYLAGKTLDNINKCAMKGTQIAHTDGGVPNLVINLADQSEYSLGELFFFFEFSCAISGYLLEINPFNQPGVEDYKKNMFALLGKPGYEEQRDALIERLNNN